MTWILYTIEQDSAIGYVQATIVGDRADIAWLVGTKWQCQGYGSEAASSLVGWLVAQDIHQISAAISPAHQASQKVAVAAGLHPSGLISEGEELWSNETR